MRIEWSDAPAGLCWGFTALAEAAAAEDEFSEYDHSALVGSCERRQMEYLAGRRLVRRVLACAGVGEPGPIPSGEAGEPVWPEGVTGSISHGRHLVTAAVGARPPWRGVGVDVEEVGRVRPELLAKIATPEERRALRGHAVPGRTLIFAAKEAYFKLQYPLLRKHPSWREVTVAVDFDGGALEVTGPDFTVPGRWRYIGDDAVSVLLYLRKD